MVDHIQECFESAVMEISALILRHQVDAKFPREDSRQRRRPVLTIRGAVGLERVHAYGCGRMKVPARFGPQWLYMAVIAPRLSAEKLVTARRRCSVEVDTRPRLRRLN